MKVGSTGRWKYFQEFIEPGLLKKLFTFQKFQEIFCANLVKNIRIIENSIRLGLGGSP